MKISRISAYRVELPLHEGSYKWSGGKSVSVFDSTIVAIDTDQGLTGYGEVCPLGPFYLPAYANGARAGIAELGPHLLGEDPRQIAKLNRRMDAALQGHPYVKSAIDIACWDLLGKACGQPVCVLLGGRYGKDFGDAHGRCSSSDFESDTAPNTQPCILIMWTAASAAFGGTLR